MEEPQKQEFAQFVAAYKGQRLKLNNLIMLNFGSAWRRFIAPFREWDASHVISADLGKSREGLALLGKATKCCADQKLMADLALTAKNRAEMMSARSDFYPVYSALISISLTVVAVLAPETWQRIIAGGVAFGFVATSAVIRMTTREQVAYLKEIANLIEHKLKYP